MTPRTDEQLESEIIWAKLKLQYAKTEPDRRVAWEKLKRLVGQRSPEQIARLERQRGLD